MEILEAANLSGPQSGDALKQARPDVHVMFMSGFTGGERLVLNHGWAFIDKPFVSKRLVEMVNAVRFDAILTMLLLQ